jgi:hypothetical protein
MSKAPPEKGKQTDDDEEGVCSHDFSHVANLLEFSDAAQNMEVRRNLPILHPRT